jgi:hypothetical protein
MAVALAACADGVVLEEWGTPQPLLSAVARHPALAQRLTALHLMDHCWSDAVVASLLALTATTNSTSTTSGTQGLSSPAAAAAAAGGAWGKPTKPATTLQPACLFAALQRVVLGDVSCMSAAPLLAALARLQAPRLCRLELRITGTKRMYGASAAEMAAAATAANNCAAPGLPAALEALWTRQQPVDAQGRPTRLELRLRGEPPAAALAAAARSVVEGAGSRAAWLVVEA